MKISVIIPSYNRDEFLQRAIESVLKQTYQALEIIVIDDGSTDNTSIIVQKFPNIKYIYQKNSGVSSARNLGIANACHEWLAFLDSDDEWVTNKLEEQVSFHKDYSETFVSYTDEIWIRDDINVKIPKKFQKLGLDVFMENLSFCNIAPSSVLIHKSIFESVGTFDESLEVCEDYDLWLRILLENKIALINKKLTKKYAGHKNQLSFKYWGMDRFRVITLEKLLQNKKDISDEKVEIIQNELLTKYTLLLKGAIKYDKVEDIQIYERKVAKFRLF
ncbi:glycosyltransferase [Sulfurimonas sp. SAG-AH-194-L11]|nr:glycosyltransferase [Sulfurimonas sp. SAG-AH-194-L11]MDF1877431.1 glycosyltransferase [Sulfurimonas sp. SAG-AH-194-L11]